MTLIQSFIIKHIYVFDEAVDLFIIMLQTIETKHLYKIDNIYK